MDEKDGIYYIKNKSMLKNFLKTECEFYRSKQKKFKQLAILRQYLFPVTESDILLKHAVLLRKTEYYINTKKPMRAVVYKTRLRLLQNKYSLHISPNNCDIGLHIMHLGPILMNEKVRVGRNCALHINTAIVAGGSNDDVPKLGDGVVIGVGAVLLGGITIADNVAIGANAVVNKSIDQENVSVAGVPAKIIGKNGRLSWNNGR